MGEINVKVLTAIPGSAGSQVSEVGSNPEIYRNIEQELRNKAHKIKEVHLAMYLFNNMRLYGILKEVAKNASVVVTSIPLAGYDKRKFDKAKEIYEDIIKSEPRNPNFELLIYPHMYVWYGAEYAEGGASYSFHIKAGYIIYRDGACKLLLTSCNMSPGDPYHSETAIVIEDLNHSSPYSSVFQKFFNQLEGRAMSWNSYHKYTRNLSSKDLQQVFDFVYIGGHSLENWQENFADIAFFTAPFITINDTGSTWYARKKIVDLIMSAERRVLVAAQHIHDIAPFNGYNGDTLIDALISKKHSNPKIEIKVLKQVSSRGLADKRRAAFVECHLDYAGIEQKVNKLVHDKFIVVDDVAIISTANFTATQFAWGMRDMEFIVEGDLAAVSQTVNTASTFYKQNAQVSVKQVRSRSPRSSKVKVIKRDIFAEVNGFIIIREESAVNQLVDHFNRLWRHEYSEFVEVLR